MKENQILETQSEPRATHAITLDTYTLLDFCYLLKTKPTLELHAEVRKQIQKGGDFVQQKVVEDRYIYGVNTGFGSLCETRISNDDIEALQYKHVLSHACGIGEVVSPDISRLTMLVKLLTFRSGNTGISLTPVQRLLDFWNHDIIPVIPKKGTVGASGDLAPLAHMALPLLGLGQVHYRGQILDSREVLEEMGWEPLTLKAKEGLALTNGVQYITARGIHCLLRIMELIPCADYMAAMSIQAFSASRTFYHKLYHETSQHLERRTVAANLTKLLEGSNHFQLSTCNRSKQDPYSFRCIPQVHGAIRQAFGFAKQMVEQESNSVSDNPLFFPDDNEILFGGNLHGESPAFAMDFLAIAMSELANISERRSYQLLSGHRGLPGYLVHNPGLNSGFMVVQYSAAALVNENKVLSTPASVDTIPTCQLQEDHVSMGGTSAYKLEQIIDNLEYVLSIELFIAAQAIEHNKELKLSGETEELFNEFRKTVDYLENDRVMSTDMEKAREFFLEHKGRLSSRIE